MPINASPEYFRAQGEYTAAKTKEDKIKALERLIMLAPKHKGSENLLAGLRSKLSKLKKEVDTEKKRKKHRASSIALVKKTADAFVVLVGLANSGKSSLLAALTNATPKISPFPFTTIKPEQGVFNYDGCKIQIVDLPSLHGNVDLDSENLGIVRISDLIVIVAISNEEIEAVLQELKDAKITASTLIVHNKSDIIQKVPSKSELSVSAQEKQNIQELKEKIFTRLKIIRVFTKEPCKKQAQIPIILKQSATIRDLTSNIHKSFLEKFNYSLVWGKSAKFKGQRCGLDHKLQDGDIVEIYLRK